MDCSRQAKCEKRGRLEDLSASDPGTSSPKPIFVKPVGKQEQESQQQKPSFPGEVRALPSRSLYGEGVEQIEDSP